MGKVGKDRVKSGSECQNVAPYALAPCSRKIRKDSRSKKNNSKAGEKKDWEDAVCSVCLEYPHNAVLLLCSSYSKGCRPYMCATSQRFSNCLEQYKKAYTKVTSINEMQQWNLPSDNSNLSLGAGEAEDKTGIPELLCPLCRGQVKGWTVVELARKHLNAKKRSCMQDNCSFVGNYKQLRRHVREEHPSARPRAVDPVLKEKWKKLEHEREQSDVISTIMSSTPGAVVLGDFVVEPGYYDMFDDYDSDESLDDGFLPLESFSLGRAGYVGPSLGRAGYRVHFQPVAVRRRVSNGPAAVSGRHPHRTPAGRQRGGGRWN